MNDEIPLPPVDSALDNLSTLLNTREWMRKALYAAGAKDGGGSGCGFGQADIDIELEGHRYNVSIAMTDEQGSQ